MTKDDLVALEREGWDALSSTGGENYYRRLLTQDALMAFPFGVLDREQSLEAIASAPPWTRYEMSAVQVVRLGEDAAVIVYQVTATRQGQADLTAVVSSTFVRHGSQWQLAFHHQSPAG